MTINQAILLAYGVFLLIILVINFLYFFQVFKYRLPGDASLPVLALYVIAMLFIIISTDLLLNLWQ
ncbi:MAG TPA: hypothetical protein VLE93_03620 [Candidatus Saccharimonadales bacterium]|nr:hypothetical protein [Candidatus Saccharimonadales bacterium]